MGLFDKIKKSLEDKREQAKEDKIKSDPKLKGLYDKFEKSAEEAEEATDDLMKKLGIDDDD